jgi:CubicO group peptidase (beta-lactamase class C family)
MKKIFFSCFLFVFYLVGMAQSTTDKLNELLQAYQKINQFNGTALVVQNGKVVLDKGYGYQNITANENATANTIYQIGSITKQFTALVILKLEEQKKLKLTDKLSDYFPGYTNGENITIFNLLTHTAGIYNYTNNVDFMQTHATMPITQKEMIAVFKDKELDFKPGTQWAYSNSGYMLLGYIIEKITKTTYENAIRKFIFTPLKMTNSGFDFVRLKNKNKATGYFVLDAKKGEPSSYVDSSIAYAAGAIYSTSADLYKWHTGILNNKLVSRSTIEKAFTPFLKKYGFGWFMDSINGKRITTHNGGIFGFNANFSRVEADNNCIILLNNVGNPKLDVITEAIYAILYQKPYTLPQEKKELILSEAVLNKYIGTYQITPTFEIVITVEAGQLMVQATGQPKFELFAQKENYFFLKAVEAELEFVMDDKGVVEKAILYQGGRKTDAKKIK